MLYMNINITKEPIIVISSKLEDHLKIHNASGVWGFKDRQMERAIIHTPPDCAVWGAAIGVRNTYQMLWFAAFEMESEDRGVVLVCVWQQVLFSCGGLGT